MKLPLTFITLFASIALVVGCAGRSDNRNSDAAGGSGDDDSVATNQGSVSPVSIAGTKLFSPENGDLACNFKRNEVSVTIACQPAIIVDGVLVTAGLSFNRDISKLAWEIDASAWTTDAQGSCRSNKEGATKLGEAVVCSYRSLPKIAQVKVALQIIKADGTSAIRKREISEGTAGAALLLTDQPQTLSSSTLVNWGFGSQSLEGLSIVGNSLLQMTDQVTQMNPYHTTQKLMRLDTANQLQGSLLWNRITDPAIPEFIVKSAGAFDPNRNRIAHTVCVVNSSQCGDLEIEISKNLGTSVTQKYTAAGGTAANVGDLGAAKPSYISDRDGRAFLVTPFFKYGDPVVNGMATMILRLGVRPVDGSDYTIVDLQQVSRPTGVDLGANSTNLAIVGGPCGTKGDFTLLNAPQRSVWDIGCYSLDGTLDLTFANQGRIILPDSDSSLIAANVNHGVGFFGSNIVKFDNQLLIPLARAQYNSLTDYSANVPVMYRVNITTAQVTTIPNPFPGTVLISPKVWLGNDGSLWAILTHPNSTELHRYRIESTLKLLESTNLPRDPNSTYAVFEYPIGIPLEKGVGIFRSEKVSDPGGLSVGAKVHFLQFTTK